MPEKFILDATAGFRMMWFNKKHPNCIYLDEKPECEPDIIGDFKDLNQFEDNKFRLIVFDPPHAIQGSSVCNSNTLREFGHLKSETWQNDLKQAFSELWRVLAPYGVLLFKWNTRSASAKDVLKLIPHEPLFYNLTAKKQNKIGKKSYTRHVRTLWFCFMKIPEAKNESLS